MINDYNLTTKILGLNTFLILIFVVFVVDGILTECLK